MYHGAIKYGRRKFLNQIFSNGFCTAITLNTTFMRNSTGVVTRRCNQNVKDTVNRLVVFLVKNGATIYARIDQQQELKNAGRDIGPLEFVLFGNAKGGGTLMAENPLVALDLPLKVIVYEDQEKITWLAYNQGSYIEERYQLKHNPQSPLFLDTLIDKALTT